MKIFRVVDINGDKVEDFREGEYLDDAGRDETLERAEVYADTVAGWHVIEIDSVEAAAPEMLRFIKEIAEFYRDTDAPSGIRARFLVDLAEGR